MASRQNVPVPQSPRDRRVQLFAIEDDKAAAPVLARVEVLGQVHPLGATDIAYSTRVPPIWKDGLR